jgi:hypothetical protein
MSQYHFGLGKGRVGAGVEKRVDKIARKHGADFTSVTLPGDGPRYWFSGPNLGFPFDRDMARAVLNDLEAAGLWPVPTRR